MKKIVKEFPEKKITITVLGEREELEYSEIVTKILDDQKPGRYTVSLVGEHPRVSFVPGDVEPGSEQGMLLPPEYFQKEDPNHPLKKYDPDNDELHPPGGNNNYFI